MKTPSISLLNIPLLTWRLLRQYLYARKISHRLRTGPASHPLPSPGRYPWKKYTLFYGTLVPVTLHEKLAALHKIPYTGNLRSVATAQAIITGVYDDLIDEWNVSPERINTILYGKDFERQAENELEILCRKYFTFILQNPKEEKLFKKILSPLICIQEESKKQINSILTPEEVMRITREKGGYALLFYRCALPTPCSPEEFEFLFELGALMQMTNDINDARKDYRSGSTTMMHLGWSVEKIEATFRDQINKTFRSWHLWQPHNTDKSPFFSRINLVLARSLITLEKYKNSLPAGDRQAPFVINTIPEKKITEGIDIPVNIFLWWKYWMNLQKKALLYNNGWMH